MKKLNFSEFTTLLDKSTTKKETKDLLLSLKEDNPIIKFSQRNRIEYLEVCNIRFTVGKTNNKDVDDLGDSIKSLKVLSDEYFFLGSLVYIETNKSKYLKRIEKTTIGYAIGLNQNTNKLIFAYEALISKDNALYASNRKRFEKTSKTLKLTKYGIIKSN